MPQALGSCRLYALDQHRQCVFHLDDALRTGGRGRKAIALVPGPASLRRAREEESISHTKGRFVARCCWGGRTNRRLFAVRIRTATPQLRHVAPQNAKAPAALATGARYLQTQFAMGSSWLAPQT